MNIGFIPIRAGSKGIPNKNMKEFCGKPLCFWVIEEALKSNLDQVWISTESHTYWDAIEKEFDKYDTDGCRLNICFRPEVLAQDDTSTEDVMLHFALGYEFDNIMLIQATNPFLLVKDINKVIDYSKLYSSQVSVATLSDKFQWLRGGTPQPSYDVKNRPRRQDGIPPILVENGSMYWNTRDSLLKGYCRLGEKTIVHTMPWYTMYEVDSPEDWDTCEYFFKRFQGGRIS